MKFYVTVRSGSKVAKIEQQSEGVYQVWVREPAKQGRANAAVVAALAQHLGISKSAVSIVHGARSKVKIVECSSTPTPRSTVRRIPCDKSRTKLSAARTPTA
ncbi:MAG: hypothetical protein A2666_05245 [Parcubacteria group bacterium RIFCSPHIGHO2_01_FULL_47_10b]|nr:MAG: hypothetical protein A2666_05245 [Parcubacteria group bacterium RIFCSPHIGHO2_01_FULL_47_10b]